LAKDPIEISVGDVIRFIDGPLEPIACLEKHYSGCKDTYKCVFKSIWQDVTQAISNTVDNITFRDLARKLQRKKQAIIYQI